MKIQIRFYGVFVCLFVCFPIKETALHIVRYYRGNYTAKYINGNNLEDENK